MKTCLTCGLGIVDNNGLVSCFKYNTLSNSQDDKTSCLYYIEKIIEDGEVLPPMQHLYFAELEIAKRKMKISINSGLRM